MSTKTIPTSSSISSAQPYNTTFYLPKELIAEILPRLPVKSLLRFRCVSKSWCSYIDSTRFVKKYLERSIECNSGCGIIFKDKENFYLADVDSLDDSTVTIVADPVKAQISGAEFIGSCNGLVCLWKSDKDLILWNPATNKCRKLPEPTNILIPSSSTFGFGYDHLSDDYKVVRISGSQLYGIMVTVYSLKSNSWTWSENITNDVCLVTSVGKFVDGALYWLATKGSYIIFAFDLGVKRHRELPFPRSVGVNKNHENVMSMMDFDGCLCIVELHINSHMDIWVKNNYGDGNSWTKLLSVQQPHMLRPFEFVCPVAFSKSRKDVLLEVHREKFVWYNLDRNEVKNVTVHGIPVKFDLLVYTRSLVQVPDNYKSKGKKMSKFLSKGFNLKL